MYSLLSKWIQFETKVDTFFNKVDTLFHKVDTFCEKVYTIFHVLYTICEKIYIISKSIETFCGCPVTCFKKWCSAISLTHMPYQDNIVAMSSALNFLRFASSKQSMQKKKPGTKGTSLKCDAG